MLQFLAQVFLSKHDIVGNMMQAGVMTYFGITAAQDAIAAQMADSQYYRQPSFGTFSIGATVDYVFGMPHDIRFTGVVMDIDRLMNLSEVNNNCWNDWVSFNQQSGSRNSLFENIVPEQLFAQEDANGNKPEGVSAVKAISVAAALGQKIYTLTSANQASLNQVDIDANAKNEIRDALGQGKTVTVHQSPINHHGWSGSGYIIADNETGTGAYKISGGSNGGAVYLIFIGFLFAMFSIGMLVGVMVATAPALLAVLTKYVLGMLVAASLIIAAGFALLEGDSFLCSKLLGAAIGLLIAILGHIALFVAGLVGSTIFSSLFSDGTSICYPPSS